MPTSVDSFLDRFDPKVVPAKIRAAAEKYGLDPALALGLAESESDFRQWATSPTGARGVFQFTQRTARELGIDRDDLDQNIDGGVRYLRQLLDRYGGDARQAFRAYKGVDAGGATDRDVDRALTLVEKYRSPVNGGNGHANGTGPDALDAFLDRFAAVPSREELETLAADLEARRAAIDAKAAELERRRTELEIAPIETARLSSLMGRAGDKAVAPLVADYHQRRAALNADLETLRNDLAAFERDRERLLAGARLFNENLRRYASSPVPGTERLGGKLPGVPRIMPRVEEVHAPSLAGELGGAAFRGVANIPLSTLSALTRMPVAAGDPLAAPPIASGEDFQAGAQTAGRETREGLQQLAQQYLPQPPITTLGQFVEMFTSTLPFMAAHLAGPAGPYVLGSLLGTEEALQRAEAAEASGKQFTPEQRAGITLAGAAIGATEGLPIGHLFGRFRRAAVIADPAIDHARLARQLFPRWRDYLASAALQAAEEGGQEAGAGVLQDLLEASYGGRPLTKIGESLLLDAAGGGLTGALLDVMMRLAGTRMGRAQLRRDGIDPDALRQWYRTEVLGQPAPQAEPAARPGEPSTGPVAEVSPETVQRIREYLEQTAQPVYRQQIVDELGIGPREAQQALDALYEQGVVQVDESERRKRYSLVGQQPLIAPSPAQQETHAEPSTPPEPTDPLAPLKERVIEIARREGRIRPWGIRNALNVDRDTAARLMAELIQDGKLTSEGKFIGDVTEQPRQQISIGEQQEQEYTAPEPDRLPAERRGATADVITPQGTPAQARWALVDLASDPIVTSHDLAGNENPDYPQQYQGRQRARIASRAQIEEIARQFDPEQAGPSRLASQGAPIDVAMPDGRLVTISGNGRTLAQRLLYERYPERAEAYRAYLRRVLPELGIDPAKVDELRMPSLRRVLVGPVRLRQFSEEANTETVARRSAAEVAVGDARKLTPELLAVFHPSETGEIGTAANAEFIRQFFDAVIPPAERGAYMDRDGQLNQDGERRIRNAIFAAAYGDASGVERMAEARDDAARGVTLGMLAAAPQIARLEADIRAGALHPLSAAADIATAARKLAYLRARHQTVADYLAQQPMFGRELTPEAEAWLRVLDEHGKAPRRLAQILRAYTDQVRALGHPQQRGLFGEQRLPSKIDLIRRAVEAELGEGQVPLLPTSPQPATPPAPMAGPVGIPAGRLKSPYTPAAPLPAGQPLTPALRRPTGGLEPRREPVPETVVTAPPSPAGLLPLPARQMSSDGQPRVPTPTFITRPPAIRAPASRLEPEGAAGVGRPTFEEFVQSGGVLITLHSPEGYVVLAAHPQARVDQERHPISGYLADYHLDDVTGGRRWRQELASRGLNPNNVLGYARLAPADRIGAFKHRQPQPHELLPLHVAVLPHWRGRGIANAMYDAAEMEHSARLGRPAQVIPAPAQTQDAKRLWARRRARQATEGPPTAAPVAEPSGTETPEERTPRQVEVDPARLEAGGDIHDAYSADRLGANKPTIRRPFIWDGQQWVTTGIAGSKVPGGRRAEAWRMIPAASFEGEFRTAPNPKLGYHGVKFRYRGQDYVLVGPEVWFVPARQTQPAAPAEPRAPQLSLFGQESQSPAPLFQPAISPAAPSVEAPATPAPRESLRRPERPFAELLQAHGRWEQQLIRLLSKPDSSDEDIRIAARMVDKYAAPIRRELGAQALASSFEIADRLREGMLLAAADVKPGSPDWEQRREAFQRKAERIARLFSFAYPAPPLVTEPAALPLRPVAEPAQPQRPTPRFITRPPAIRQPATGLAPEPPEGAAAEADQTPPPAASEPPTEQPSPASATIAVTGDTYRHRHQLAKLPGAKWDAERKAWLLPDTPENREAIRRISDRLIIGTPSELPADQKEFTPIRPGHFTVGQPVFFAAPRIGYRLGRITAVSDDGKHYDILSRSGSRLFRSIPAVAIGLDPQVGDEVQVQHQGQLFRGGVSSPTNERISFGDEGTLTVTVVPHGKRIPMGVPISAITAIRTATPPRQATPPPSKRTWHGGQIVLGADIEGKPIYAAVRREGDRIIATEVFENIPVQERSWPNVEAFERETGYQWVELESLDINHPIVRAIAKSVGALGSDGQIRWDGARSDHRSALDWLELLERFYGATGDLPAAIDRAARQIPEYAEFAAVSRNALQEQPTPRADTERALIERLHTETGAAREEIEPYIEQIRRAGHARRNRVEVRIIPHPAAPARTEPDAPHFAVELTTEWGGRGIVSEQPVTLAEAQHIALRELFRPTTTTGPSTESTKTADTAEQPPPSEPAPTLEGAQLRLIDRIRHAIDTGEDIRLRLERIAEEVYGGTRAAGAFEMRDLYEAQEAAVNGWLRDNARRLMALPFADAVAELRAVLGRLATETVRNQQQIDLQQFSTPPTIALLVAKLADPQPSDVLLEPSAGTGGLAALLEPLVAETHLNEIDPQRAALAEAIGLPKATQHNAEVLNALLDRGVQPTLIVMNPPFTRAAGGALKALRYGFLHLDQALQRLEPGGRLVALLTGGRTGFEDVEGAGLNAPGAREYWRRTADKYNILANVRLSGKEYAKYGTSMPVQIVVIEKTGPTPPSTGTDRLAAVAQGKYNTVEEVYDALQAVIAANPRRQPGADAGSAPGRRESGSLAGVPLPGKQIRGRGGGTLSEAEGTRPGLRPGSMDGGRPGGLQPGPAPEPQRGESSGTHRPPELIRGGEPETGAEQPVEPAPAGGGRGPVSVAEAQLGGAGLGPEQGAVSVEPGSDLATASGLSADEVVDAATKALAELLGQGPPTGPSQPEFLTQPPAIRQAAETQVGAPPTGPSPTAKLDEAAQRAAERLRAKIRGQQLQAGIDPQDLIDLATIGANYLVKGTTRFADWSRRMLAEAGDIVRHFAAETKRTIDSILREIHRYAAQVAKRFGVEVEPAPAEEPTAEHWVKIVPAPLTGGPAPDAGTFVEYRPSIQGSEHKGVLVETQTMASVSLPPLTYQPYLPQWLLDSGELSAAQLEAVVIAGQANETILPSGHRAAALVGDGTGVGKGRIIAGISLDNWNHGRRRIVWITDNWRLIKDAERDLKGVGAALLARTLKPADKFPYGVRIEHEGVLFAPYSWLRSEDRQHRKRIEQLIEYVRGADDGEGAVVIFDESHNLKNTVTKGQGKPSATGAAAAKLLDAVPRLRAAFLSATAATELTNMGYLSRLGLWGPGTPFPGGFNDFLMQLGRGGLSAMELLARELKILGRYISRTISYKGVILREDAVHHLNEDQKAIYRSAAEMWRQILDWIDHGIAVTNGGYKEKAEVMKQYWGAQQRFFNLLLTAMKVPTAIEHAQRALAEGYSVVISLINTNEAAQQREEKRLKKAQEEGLEEDEIDELDFGPASILTGLIERNFPVQQFIDGVDPDGKPIKVPLVDANNNPVLNPEAVRMRDELIRRIKSELRLPKNPLDLLIEGLGGHSEVAELTGREKIYDEATGKFIPRGEPGMSRQKINIAEAEAFQQGKKRVAIISTAASTGISLHSDNTKANRQKRLHITLQPGWSADRAMQMLGRTHRTNQAHPPEYLMVVTDLGGEKRFIATIARRLSSLGAITKGSREAAGANAEELSKLNLQSTEGQRAADAFYAYLLRNPEVAPGLSGLDVLRLMGVLHVGPGGAVNVEQGDRYNVDRLLNRLLSLDPDVQNATYEIFYNYFEEAVAQALEDGTLDVGVRQLRGEHPRIVEKRVLATDKTTGADTYHYIVEVDVRTERFSPERLDELIRRHENGQFYRIDARGEEHIAFVVPAPDTVHADGRTEKAFYVFRPDRGRQKITESSLPGRPLAEYLREGPEELRRAISRLREEVQIHRNLSRRPDDYYAREAERKQALLERAETEYARLTQALPDPLEEGRRRWREEFDATPEYKTERHDLLGGTVLKWWGRIQDAGMRGIYSVQDSRTGERIVGVEIAPSGFQGLIEAIAGQRSAVTPRQVWIDVLENGTPYQLAYGVRLTLGRVGRNPVIQVHPGASAARLKALGVRYERGVVPIYYIPDSDEGREILGRVLEEFPVEERREASQIAYALRKTPINPDASPEELARDADAEYRPDNFGGHIRINWQGRGVLTAMLQVLAADQLEGEYLSKQWQAVTIALPTARRLLEALEQTPSLGAGFSRLRDAFIHALNANRPVIVVEEGQDPGEADELLNEERFHQEQNFRHLSKPSAQRLMRDPAGAAIARWLVEHTGTPAEDFSLEIPAHANRGSRFWTEIGITPQQAATLLDLYFELLEGEHGVEAAEQVWRAVQGELRPLLRRHYGKQKAGEETNPADIDQTEGRRLGPLEPLKRRSGAGESRRTGPASQTGTAANEQTQFHPDRAVARGTELLRAGVTHFADWSRRMLAEFGEAIKPHLRRIYEEAKRFWQDTSGQSELEIRAITALTEHAQRLARGIRSEVGARARRSAVAALLEEILLPLDVRIAREGGGAGKPLMAALRRAGDFGEVAAGKRLLRLGDSGLARLTKEQRWNLLDVLEGRDDAMDDQVAEAYRVIREITDELAGEAEDLEVRVRTADGTRREFFSKENYFPHLIRNVDALRSGPVRRDVVENLVRLEIQPNRRLAEAFLDEYIGFIESGGRREKLLQYLVQTGQARNQEEALQKLLRFRSNLHRHGSLEYAREVDLPFYDPDPARVLPTHVASGSIRLAQIAELGQDNQVVARHLKRIADAGGNAEWVDRAVQRLLGHVNAADSKMERASRWLRALQTVKLGLASIPNSTQGVLNSLLAADLPALARGLRAALGKPGRRLAIESGATIDPVLHEPLRELAGSIRAVERYLAAVGFTATERANRIIAANVGVAYAQRLLTKLIANPGHARARRALAELGIDPEAARARGRLTGDEVLMAAKRFSDLTQFRSRPEDHPEWASTNWGKVFFQFKTFIYGQTRLLYRSLIEEARRGEFGRAFRNLLILAVLFPLTGEAILALRNLLTGRERDSEGLRRYLESAAAVGSLGIVWDMIESAERRKPLEFAFGPSAGMAGDIMQAAFTDPGDLEEWKRVAYRHAPLGAVARRLIEGPQ